MTHSLPPTILRDLPWSFAEPACRDAGALVAALREYSRSIGHVLNESELHRRLPGTALDVKYPYWVRGAGGAWEELFATVEIRKDRSPTYAEILFVVHQEAGDRLASQDGHYFEGLVLAVDSPPTVPVYEMWLGS